MKFSKEMKDFFRESMGDTRSAKIAADYLYGIFLEEAWKGKNYDRGDNPDWNCLLYSKAYKDMVESFRWVDKRWECNSTLSFKKEMFDMMDYQDGSVEKIRFKNKMLHWS